MPSGNEAFSTLAPTYTAPDAARTAAPTRKPEYGAWACALTARAAANSSEVSSTDMATQGTSAVSPGWGNDAPASVGAIAAKQYRQTRFRRPPGSTELFIVRHGESEPLVPGNPFPLVDGHGDPALAPEGRGPGRTRRRRASPATPSTPST